MVFPAKVCCITNFHDGVPGEIVRVTMVTTDMRASVHHRDKILFHREWWVRDVDLDTIHEEVDFLVGLLRRETPSAFIMHVEGTAQLTAAPGGYLSSYVKRQELLSLMATAPEKFSDGGGGRRRRPS